MLGPLLLAATSFFRGSPATDLSSVVAFFMRNILALH